MTTEKDIALQVRMPPAVYAKAKERAQAANMGLSEWIRSLIDAPGLPVSAPKPAAKPQTASPGRLKHISLDEPMLSAYTR